MSDLTEKAEVLISLRKSCERLAHERKELQSKLLSDVKFQELITLEKQSQESYQISRDEFTEEITKKHIEESIEAESGFIGITPTRTVEIVDEKRFTLYAKKNKVLNRLQKITWKKSEVKKFVLEIEGLGGRPAGIKIDEKNTISVNFKK